MEYTIVNLREEELYIYNVKVNWFRWPNYVGKWIIGPYIGGGAVLNSMKNV